MSILYTLGWKTRVYFPVLLLFSLLTFATRLDGQTYREGYLDGSMYLKVQQSMPIELPTFTHSEVPQMDAFFAGLEVLCRKHQVTSLVKFGILEDPVLKKYFRINFKDIAGTGQFMEELQALPYLEIVELKPLDRIVTTVNDMNLISNLGWQTSFNPSSYHLDLVNATDAWDYTTGSSNIKIAVVDDACRRTHQDLVNNIAVNTGEIAGNNIDDDGNGYKDDVLGYDVADNDGNVLPPSNANNSRFTHGTHTNGIAGASTNNGIGTASLGYNCKLVPVKCTPDTASNSDLIYAGYEGIQYAVKAGAKVISLSWGSGQTATANNSAVAAAIAAGIVVVGAAGNDGVSTAYYPANYPNVIAVGACDPNGSTYSGYSNYGTWIDVVAPGNLYSTLAGNPSNASYGVISGTSMACPMVASLCGLMLSYNPALTVAQLTKALKDGCTNLDAANPSKAGKMGAGLINAWTAIKNARPSRCVNDTLTTHFAGTASLYSTSNGEASGSDVLGSKAKAQRFTGYTGYNEVKALKLRFARVVNTSGSGTVNVQLWGMNTAGNLPGASLQSVSVSLSDIANDIANGKETVVTFANPVEVRGTFYGGVSLPTTAGDSAFLYLGSVTGSVPTNAFLQASNNAWSKLDVSFTGANSLNLAVFPVMTAPEITNNAVITPPPSTEATKSTVFTTPSDGDTYWWYFPGGTIRNGKSTSIVFLTTGQKQVVLQVIKNGCSYYDTLVVDVTPAVTAVDPTVNESNVVVYPNPATDHLTIQSGSKALEHVTIVLTDLAGREVLSVSSERLDAGATLNVPVTQFNAGVYLLQVRHTAGTQNLKWLKQ
jgi:subtilisin family serine protease